MAAPKIADVAGDDAICVDQDVIDRHRVPLPVQAEPDTECSGRTGTQADGRGLFETPGKAVFGGRRTSVRGEGKNTRCLG